MKKKFILLKDVRNEILINSQNIVSLENEIERLKLRQQYLNAIEDYFSNDFIQPYIKGNLLTDDFELEKFVFPLIMNAKMKLLENQISLLKCSKKEQK